METLLKGDEETMGKCLKHMGTLDRVLLVWINASNVKLLYVCMYNGKEKNRKENYLYYDYPNVI